jgi:hypothetical protein
MGSNDLQYKMSLYELSPGTSIFLKAGTAYKNVISVQFVPKVTVKPTASFETMRGR